MKLPTTPLFRSNIGDGFGKVPAMAAKILSIVLALAIGMIYRFAQNDGSVLPRAFAVTDGIFDSYLHALRVVGRHISFADRETALASFHLNAVISNAQTNREAKCLRQPIGGRAGVRISEHRDYGTRRHRSVESHLETLPLIPKGKLIHSCRSARSEVRHHCLTIFSTLPA